MNHHRAARGLALCLLLALGCAGKRGEPAGPATLGAGLRSIDPLGREDRFRGAVLEDLEAAGPAARAGLRSGDLVQAIDGIPVDDPCGLERALLQRHPGQEVKLVLRRRGERLDKTVALAGALDLYGPACDSGRAAACHRLGVLYATGAGVPADPERAAGLNQKACDGGNAGGCADLGIFRLQANDEAGAQGLFHKACDGGSAAGCAHLAFLYATGKGGSQDDKRQDDARAFDLYQKACEGGDGPGCYNVGLHLKTGRGTIKNPSRALIAYQKACDLGSFLGCTNQAFFYERGLSTPASPVRAAALYRRACAGSPCESGDPQGCFNLGVLHRDGQGVALDKAEAARYFERSCDGGSTPGCANLADLLFAGDGVARDEKRATELFRRACDGGHTVSCRNIAVLETGETGSKETTRAAARLEDVLPRRRGGGVPRAGRAL